MADLKWIKITTDIFDDEKILLIESLPDGDSLIVIWFKLLCLAGKQNNDGIFIMNNRIPYTIEMLATIFRRKPNVVSLALQTFEEFGMVEIVDGAITIPNWEKHQNVDEMEKIREQNRARQARFKERQKQKLLPSSENNVTETLPVTLSNATEKNKNEKRIENNIVVDGGLLVNKGDRSTPPASEVEQIKAAWNEISFTQDITDPVPGTPRWNEIQICIQTYGFETVMEAIRKVGSSEWLKKKGKNRVRFDSYINTGTIQKLIEGAYDEDFSKSNTKSIEEQLEEWANG